MLTREDAQNIAENWIQAWNDRDLDRIISHYTSDLEFSSPLVVRRMGLPSGRLHGVASLSEYFAKGLEGSMRIHFELVTVAIGPTGMCMVYRRESGATVCEVLEVNEQGRIQSACVYYDRDP